MVELIRSLLKRVLPRVAWERLQQRYWLDCYPLWVDYCPLMLPWFPGRRRTPIGELHRYATFGGRLREVQWLTRLCVVIGALLWPIRVAVGGTQAFREYSSGVEAVYGIVKWRQLGRMLRQAGINNVPPLFFYRYRLFTPRESARADRYIFPDERIVLFPRVAGTFGLNHPLIYKDTFFERGRELDLPVVPALVKFEGGAVARWYASSRDLPECDLAFKPVDRSGSQGFERWRYDASTRQWRRGRESLDANGLLEHCCQTGKPRRHLLQACVVNHKELRPLSGVGLSTLRVVTYRRPNGDCGVLIACMRMPTGASPVDNFSAHGVAAPIDVHTGTLGPAVSKDPQLGEFTHHPDSGAPIAGVVIPRFQEALEVALAAQSAFPEVPSVGWDVAITDDGPLLLEANLNWGVDIVQIVGRGPLGDTKYPELYFEHLASQRPALVAE